MSTSLDPAVEFFAAERRRKFPWINLALFILTCCTTLIVGTLLMVDFRHTFGTGPVVDPSSIWRNPAILLNGLPFCMSIMTILFAHEMGHYLTCRYYGIDASLPYFIPMPVSPVGTMGAFIRIRSAIQHRPALLEVGIAGPIAGFVLAVPTLVIGLLLSGFVATNPSENGFSIGEPLIFKIGAFLLGKTPPQGMELYVHPIAFAAWFGFFATAMNLLPAGQLDGGHVLYALLGDFHKKISLGLVLVFIPLGIFLWPGWLVWATLLLFLGLHHPVTLDDSVPLQRRHKWLGWIALAMFVLCFTPVPFYLN
jgi:membrane-associated protease RseP (regulator of RpoE activity)